MGIYGACRVKIQFMGFEVVRLSVEATDKFKKLGERGSRAWNTGI